MDAHPQEDPQEDPQEEEKREEGFDESPQMEPRGNGQIEPNDQTEEEGSPDFVGGVVVADDLPERQEFEQLREAEQESPERDNDG